jgi:hypothetical protein
VSNKEPNKIYQPKQKAQNTAVKPTVVQSVEDNLVKRPVETETYTRESVVRAHYVHEKCWED